jgi:type II secretory pathway predicted ATPase ExeA
MKLTDQFKERIASELLSRRINYTTTDGKFAAQFGLTAAIYSRLKNGERERLISEDEWLNLGRLLNISPQERQWHTVETVVFRTIKEDVEFCQKFSKSRICVDECGIGKTHTAKYLAKSLKNCFYIDASQTKTKQLFIRALAQSLGLNPNGRYIDVFENIKYYLNTLPSPVVIIDEAGKLNKDAFEEIQALWNGTENFCGWYLMGANGFRKKLVAGIARDKEGFAEIFSRFSEKFTTTVPIGKYERQEYYRLLITQVISANIKDKSKIDLIVNKCITSDKKGSVSGLRRAESLILLHKA